MRYLNVISTIFTVAMLTSVASAGVWQENFDNGLPDGWNAVRGEWEIEKDDSPPFAVEPHDKLATRWGQLKTDLRIGGNND